MGKMRGDHGYYYYGSVHYGESGVLDDHRFTVIVYPSDPSVIALEDGESGERFYLTAAQARDLAGDLRRAAGFTTKDPSP